MGAVKVTFLGTGSSGDPSPRCGITAVTLPDGTVILVDTAGGNEIWHALRQASIDVARIRVIVLTHHHLDHEAGIPFVLFRLAMAGIPADGHRGPIDVCAPASAVDDLRRMCEILFPGLFTPWWIGDRVRWHGCTSDRYVWGFDVRDDGITCSTPCPKVSLPRSRRWRSRMVRHRFPPKRCGLMPPLRMVKCAGWSSAVIRVRIWGSRASTVG